MSDNNRPAWTGSCKTPDGKEYNVARWTGKTMAGQDKMSIKLSTPEQKLTYDHKAGSGSVFPNKPKEEASGDASSNQVKSDKKDPDLPF